MKGTEETTEILIVDDDEAIRHVLGRILTRKGYSVAFASSGREAIEKIAIKPPDLAIIDLNLQDMNGLELSRLMIIRSPKSKRIILTGMLPEQSAREKGSQEALRILVKPITSEELLAAIEQTLNEN